MKEKHSRGLKKNFGIKVDIKILLKEASVEDIMTKKVISIRVDAPFSKVPKILHEHNIRHLPVVDKKNKLVGLITQRDLFKIQSPRKLMDGQWYYDDEILNCIILKNVMMKKPFMMTPEISLKRALEKMVYSKHGCILIVNPNKVLCGIITQIDILEIFVQGGIY